MAVCRSPDSQRRGPTASLRHDYVADFAPRVDLAPERAALLLIDFQHALASRSHGLGRLLAAEGRLHEATYRFERIERVAVPNAARLLAAWRERDLPRLFLTVGSELPDFSDLPPHLRELCRATNNRAGEREHELLTPLRPRPDERLLNKLTLSPFASTPLELVLRSWGVEALVLAGITTNMCVEHTLRDAADRGFGCVLAEDACAADSEEAHASTRRVVGRLYGRVATTESVIEEVIAACTTS